MVSANDSWLPHLSPEVISKTEGNFLDAYVVALEGWRRGLTLRWHVKDSEKFKEMKTWFVEQPGQLFSLHSEERSHYFFRTRGDKVPIEAVDQGMDKQKTKEILSKAQIPVPQGRRFNGEYTEDDIVNYGTSLGFPVVIKPKDGSFGRGVTSGIKNVEELKIALTYLQNELKENDIIVEKHIEGKDYRIYVVGDKVVGAILRVAPNLIGDGINPIETLIKQKNASRNLNPRLVSCPIRVDDETLEYLNQFNYSLNTIPKKGRIIYTNNKANISLGGDPIDVLDDLSEEVKETAVNALHAVSGLEHGAVDVMIETSSDGKETGYVLELNPTAQLGGILFPIEGQPRDVPSAIIDFYFPETINNHRNMLAYFDLQEVITPLMRGVATITKVSSCKRKNVETKNLDLTGDFITMDALYWLRSTLLHLDLNGTIKAHNETSIEIIVMGHDTKMEEFKTILETSNQSIHISNIVESPWERPVKLGVVIKDSTNNLILNIKTKRMQISDLQKQQQRLEKEHNNMLNSNSWQITKPIRKIAGGIKQLIKKT